MLATAIDIPPIVPQEPIITVKKINIEVRRSLTTFTDTSSPDTVLYVTIGKDLPTQVTYYSPVKKLIETASAFILAAAAALPIDEEKEKLVDSLINEKSRNLKVKKLERLV